MPEEKRSFPSPERLTTSVIIGAAFKGGQLAPFCYDWINQEYLVPLLDPTKDEERRRYWLENTRPFSDGTLANPELVWKLYVDKLVTDLKTAGSRAYLGRESIRNTELDLKAAMAISASARAMEMSAGDLNKYLNWITGDGDLDKKDSWADFLLHGDPKKLNRILNDPLVSYYFKKLLRDAGITEFKPWDDNGQRPSQWRIDEEEAKRGRLVEYLTRAGSEGLNEYIAEVLLKEDTKEFIEQQGILGLGDTCRWAAARLACDIFLVDLYTRWEFQVDPDGDLNMKPSLNWGGSPLRSILEPSFLPRRVKKVYRDNYTPILNLLDKSLKPEDIFEEWGLTSKIVLPSMIEDLKRLARLNRAILLLIGGSQASSLPKWTDNEIGGILGIAEEINQLYGNISTPERPNAGKMICGIMMARIIQLKALAAAVEVGKGGKISQFFREDEKRPFYNVLVALWGPDFKARTGILASLAGGRLGFVFKGNEKAEKSIKDAYDILYSADASSQRKEIGRVGKVVDAVLDIGEVLAKVQEVWT